MMLRFSLFPGIDPDRLGPNSSPAQMNTNGKILLRHCEPERRGNLIFDWDCFVASLLAMTRYLFRLYSLSDPSAPQEIQTGEIRSSPLQQSRPNKTRRWTTIILMLKPVPRP
jgi:hypothetical protein